MPVSVVRINTDLDHGRLQVLVQVHFSHYGSTSVDEVEVLRLGAERSPASRHRTGKNPSGAPACRRLVPYGGSGVEARKVEDVEPVGCVARNEGLRSTNRGHGERAHPACGRCDGSEVRGQRAVGLNVPNGQGSWGTDDRGNQFVVGVVESDVVTSRNGDVGHVERTEGVGLADESEGFVYSEAAANGSNQ